MRNKTQLSIYIVGAMLLADFVLFGYWPSQQRLGTLQQAQAKQQSAVVLAEAQRRELGPLQRQLSQCEQALAAYSDRIPPQRELGSFIQQVSDLMTQHHLQDQVISPGEEVLAGELMTVPVTVRCKGPLSDLFGFYRQFASIGRLGRLDKAQFINDPNLGGVVRMEARMVIFYRADAPSDGVPSSRGIAQ